MPIIAYFKKYNSAFTDPLEGNAYSQQKPQQFSLSTIM